MATHLLALHTGEYSTIYVVYALLPDLRKNLGALKQLGEIIPSGSRNTLARGLIVSRLSYLIGICGVTENHKRQSQILLIGAARWVTGKNQKQKQRFPT